MFSDSKERLIKTSLTVCFLIGNCESVILILIDLFWGNWLIDNLKKAIEFMNFQVVCFGVLGPFKHDLKVFFFMYLN